MSARTLLLSFGYEPMGIISEVRLFKLLANGKVEILETWDDQIQFGQGNVIEYPAVVKMNYSHNRWRPKKQRFNRYSVFKRDRNECVYCGTKLGSIQLTIDHVVPKSQGGKNNWLNCVTSCFDCNNRKGSRTPEQAKMRILRLPKIPSLSVADEIENIENIENQHSSWKNFVSV